MRRCSPLFAAVLQSLLALALARGGRRLQMHSNITLNEKELLLTFRDGISNWDEVQAAWGLDGWCRGADAGCRAPVCTWGGVECSPYHSHEGNYVTHLILTCKGCKVPMRGRLRPGINRLQHLEVFHVQGNQLSGTLPPEWGEPNSFPELLEFNINDNQLTGNIPNSWAIGPAFLMVADLQMAGNRFSGPFPVGFAATNTSFISVMSFSFANNQFSGTLPNYINGMITMSVAEMHNNRFTGTLPPDWGTQGYWWNSTLNNTQALEYLTLHGNNLTGGLPDAWAAPGSFTALEQLTLSDNPHLGGTLPLSWGNQSEALPSLQDLNVSNCGLTGPLPAWGPGLQKLRTLTVSANALTGSIPNSWTQLDGLSQVTLHPGNPGLCTILPQGAAFKACDGNSLLCNGKDPLPYNATVCDKKAPEGPDDGSFPVAAVVVPVAAVCAAAVVGLGVRLRRRRRRRAAATQKQHEYQDAENGLFCSASSAHPQPNAGHNGVAGKDWLPWLAGRSFEVQTYPTQGGVLQLSGKVPSAARSPSQAASPGCSAGLAPSLAAQVLRISTSSSSMPPGSERTSSSQLPGGPTADNPCFSSQELALLQLSDWEIRPEEIQILKRPDGSDWQLGSGGFGTVFKAMRNGVQPVAVKVLGTVDSRVNSGVIKAVSNADLMKEISILRACRDTNILQFQGACFDGQRTLLVTEYMEGGNLTHNLRTKKVTWWRRGKKVALDVARALVYLHSRRIIHLDIKSANVLLTRDGAAKVGDVGMAKIMAGDYVSGVVGTLAWSAPELLMGQRCTEKADVYSMGVVLWEICTGETPVRGQLRDPRVPEECPAETLDLVYRCLSPDPAARPTATQLVELLQNAPGTPGLSTEVSAVGAALAPAAGCCSGGFAAPPAAATSASSASAGSRPGDSGGGGVQQGSGAQQAQQAQHRGVPSSEGAPWLPPLAAVEEDGGLAELPAGCPASLGWQNRSSGNAMSVKSQQELEEELVEELVAESAPNSGAYSGAHMAGPPSGGAALQRRLVLPTTALACSSPFSAPSPFQPAAVGSGAAPAQQGAEVQSPFAAAAPH
ncbi:hypothetical protein ABPG77_005727 [Micractinium sp. CCAP 211/92]